MLRSCHLTSRQTSWQAGLSPKRQAQAASVNEEIGCVDNNPHCKRPFFVYLVAHIETSWPFSCVWPIQNMVMDKDLLITS